MHVFTDGSREQNQNVTMLRFWRSLEINLIRVSQKFFTISLKRGHSYKLCDRHFGMTERKQRKIERVETFEEWNSLMEESGKGALTYYYKQK